MFRLLFHWRLPVALLAVVAGTADAQLAPPLRTADPANPQAQVPPAQHSSAFAGYRRHAEAAPSAWKDANDTVARIGGWRTYAREAAAPAASEPARRAAP